MRTNVKLVSVALVGAFTFSLGGGLFFDDFSDEVADGWSSDQGDWVAAEGIYIGTGEWINNRVWNISTVDSIFHTNVSVQAEMHSDAGPDDVSKMIVLRYTDPDNFLVVNFRAGDRRDVVVEQVENGIRSYVVGEFQFFINQHGQTEWHHCRADLDGKRVVAYFDGKEVLNKLVPAIVSQPGSVGAATFASSISNIEEIYVDNFSASLVDLVPISSLSLFRGTYFSGGVNDLSDNDNSYYVARPGATPIVTEAPIQIIFKGAPTFSDVNELRFKLEAAVDVSDIQQSIDLFNFNTGQYEQVDTRLAKITDTFVEVLITSNPNRFVRPGTDGVLARVRFRPNTPPPGLGWKARIDRAMWSMSSN